MTEKLSEKYKSILHRLADRPFAASIGLVLLLAVILYATGRLTATWIDRKHDRAMVELKEQAAASEARAGVHRENEAKLQQQIEERDEMIATKDKLLAENNQKAKQINEEIKAEDERYRAELARGAPADSEHLRANVCAKLKEAGIDGGSYCARTR